MTLDKVLLAQTDYFKQALSYNSFGDQEVREQLLSSASRALAYKPDIKTPQDQNTYLQALQALVTEADTEVKSAYPSTKDDARELQVYATLYSSLGQFKEAEKYLVEAHAISPRKQRISFDLMSTYLGEAKTKEAYDLALETYLYATDYPDAATALGVASILAHKEADATAVFVAHNQTFPLTPEIINAYVNVGNLGKAFTLLDQYKKLNPSRSAEVDAYMKTLLDRSRAK
jgi:tetratricopeptide (TPR) repeat protein